MAFTPPNFNLLIDYWFPGNNPSIGAADVTAYSAQLYMHSRADIDSLDSNPGKQWPNIVWRVGKTATVDLTLPLKGGVIGWTDVAGSTWYYLVDFWEWVHAGFGNQYVCVYARQCNNDGTMPDGGR